MENLEEMGFSRQLQELTEENAALIEQQKILKKRYEQKASELKIVQEHSAGEQTTHISLLKEKEEAARALSDTRKYSEQLELAMKQLPEKAHESSLELNQLKEDLYRSQQSHDHLREQLALSQKCEQEQSGEIRRLQTENQEVTEELRALQEQFVALRSRIIESQETVKNVSEENKKQEFSLEEKNKLFLKFEREINSIKETLTKGLLEAKDVESRYLEVVNEKAALYSKSMQYEELLERSQSEIKTLQDELVSLSKQEKDLKEQLENNQKSIQKTHHESLTGFQQKIDDLESRLQKYQDLLRLKEQQIDEGNTQVSQLFQEKHRLEDLLSNITRYQEEQEARIKVAQQHLGKKVKEAALFNEKMEELKVQNSDLQVLLNQLKLKMNEAQSSFEQQILQEKKMQEQLNEAVRFAESQASKWEEKYVETYEKLKTLEEKQQQMHRLFTSLGNVIGAQPFSTQTIPSSSLPPELLSQPLKIVEHMTEPSHQPKENTPLKQPSLFDVEQSYTSYRQNLFD